MRGRFARLCIEIDTNVTLKTKIRFGAITQKLEYKGINLICFQCGKITHKKDNCPSLQSINVSNVSPQVVVDGAGKQEATTNFGP